MRELRIFHASQIVEKQVVKLLKSPKNQGFQRIFISKQNTFDRGGVFASFPLAFGSGAGDRETFILEGSEDTQTTV
jgi:hypothetical protein